MKRITKRLVTCSLCGRKKQISALNDFLLLETPQKPSRFVFWGVLCSSYLCKTVRWQLFDITDITVPNVSLY